MSRDRVRRRARRDVPDVPSLEPEVLAAAKPLFRIELVGSVRHAVARDIWVDVHVCATGELCAWAAQCGKLADVEVTARGGELKPRAWCVGHWRAVRAIYVAVAGGGGGVRYGPGALNVIALREILHPWGER